jgi:hypothetical protein
MGRRKGCKNKPKLNKLEDLPKVIRALIATGIIVAAGEAIMFDKKKKGSIIQILKGMPGKVTFEEFIDELFYSLSKDSQKEIFIKAIEIAKNQ